jgi:hypothetical protein
VLDGQSVGRDETFVTKAGWHADVDNCNLWLVKPHAAHQAVDLGHHVDYIDPGCGQETSQALPNDQRIVSDHDSHGSSTIT